MNSQVKPDHVLLSALANQLGMDKSHARRYIIKRGVVFRKVRDANGQLNCAITAQEADALIVKRKQDGWLRSPETESPVVAASAPGKYDEAARAVLLGTRARVAIVCVIDGDRGNGFSVATFDPKAQEKLPALLRKMATLIEATECKG
jgi:hypothetical protein